MDQRGYCDSQV